MSIKDRLADGVSSLFEKSDGDALRGIDPKSMERELRCRREGRKTAGSPAPSENMRAVMAAAGDKARAQRAAMAAKRVKRIHAAREKKAAAQRRDQDAAYRHMAEEAKRNPPPGPRSSSTRSSQSRSRSSRSSAFPKDDLAQHYKTLDVEYGADATTVKKSYRKLMRKYHPDLHQDPRKKKAATNLTVKISAAYAAIEKHRK